MNNYEVTDNNSNSPHQSFGQRDIAGFHIETHYLIQTTVKITDAFLVLGPVFSYTYTLTTGADLQSGETITITGMTDGGNNGTFQILSVVPGTSFTVSNLNGFDTTGEPANTGTGTIPPPCNTSGTICANPDNGFLTITNNTGSAFTGTITLRGNSPTAGDPSCPVGGVANDSVTYTGASPLAAAASVTLALGSQGTVANPKNADSSNCGGFNQPLGPYPLTGTVKFLMGDSTLAKTAPGLVDEFDITPAGANAGDTIQLQPFPVPAGPPTGMGLNAPVDANGLYFGNELLKFPPTVVNPPTRFKAVNYPTQASIPIESLSAPGNPVGLELDVKCTPGDPDANDCDSFLWSGQQWFHVDPNSYGDNEIGGVAYLGQHFIDTITTLFDFNAYISYTDGPLHPGNSVYAGTFTPGAPAIVGTDVTKILVGFRPPVSDVDWNLITRGQAVSLKFTSTVIGLTECGNLTGSGCTTPWLNVSILPITCKNGMMNTSTLFDASATGASGLQQVTPGSYVFTLDTPKNPTYTCFTPVFTFSNGPSIYFDGTNTANTAKFQFK
jgi:hypothetical protein